MEVQSRPLLTPGSLTSVATSAWAHRWAVLAATVVLTVSALVAVAQPIDSPWWTYADADASYAASSLNLLLGRQVRFVDHPGLPLTEAGAVAFGADLLLDGRGLGQESRLGYVREVMLDLDRARPVFRGLAIAFFLIGALLAFLFVTRLLGHWTWGLAAGLLWIASPGLAAMSVQFRPDVLLAVLCFCFAYLIGRAVTDRSAGSYAAAAVVAGVAVMVKLHAAGLLAPLALAVVWRPPLDEWWNRLRVDTVGRLRRRRLLWALVGLAWLSLAVFFNWERAPFSPTREQLSVLAVLLVTPALLVLAARLASKRAPQALGRAFSPLYGFVAGAFVTGLLLPVTLDIPDGLQALLNVVKSGTGQGVQEGVDSFSTPFWGIDDLLSNSVLLVLVLAAIGGVVGIIRRDPRPVVWATGAFALAVLAFARPPAVHYFAPAFVLSIPAALWLLQRERRAPASLLVWPVILFIVWPTFRDRHAPAIETERFAALVEPSRHLVEPGMQPGQVILVQSSWPFPDARYFELVHLYASYSPERRYRYLPSTAAAAAYAAGRQLRPRYYIGPQAANVGREQRIALGEFGEYTVRRVPETEFVLELLSGPGIDRPWGRPGTRTAP